MIKACPSKSCELDPIPTSLLKKTLPALSSIIAEVTNTSIKSGCFPTKFKEALVKPLLKKANLDLIKKNYRPVSNLAFVGKIIEIAVAIQLINHISINKPMEPNQSAYKPFHSTETTLLRVKADILKCIDNQEIVCLVLLDLLAVFDTVDHTILLNRLHEIFRVTGTSLKLFESYLRGRSQRVVMGNPYAGGAISDPKCLVRGVPQGSVLGPIVFSLYTTPLGDICRSHHIQFLLYADDQQLYLSF